VVLSVEVSASLGENTLAAGPHTIANINIKPRTSSKAQAYALQLAALQLLKKECTYGSQLENAVSVSSVLLLTEDTLTEVPEKKMEHAAGLEQMSA